MTTLSTRSLPNWWVFPAFLLISMDDTLHAFDGGHLLLAFFTMAPGHRPRMLGTVPFVAAYRAVLLLPSVLW